MYSLFHNFYIATIAYNGFVLVCTSGDVRLSGGQTENEGTVEICFDNLWGLVAQNEWSTADAEVTCRQLGYPPEGADIHLFMD